MLANFIEFIYSIKTYSFITNITDYFIANTGNDDYDDDVVADDDDTDDARMMIKITITNITTKSSCSSWGPNDLNLSSRPQF